MKRRTIVIVLILLAFALRLWGIAFGLPDVYHPDEPAFVLQALAIARGLPRAVTFANPPLLKYFFFIEYVITFLIGRIGGAFTSPQDFGKQFLADPTLLYLIARGTSAAFGTLTAVVVYLLTMRIRGPRAALLAAAFTSVAYLLVRESHLAVNDALLTLLTTLALYASVRVFQNGERRAYIIAGTAIGLAFSAKYTGAIGLVPLLLAHCFRIERRAADLLFACGAALTTVVLTFPSLVLETNRVLNDIYWRLYLPGQLGYDGLDPAGAYVYYVKVLVWGIGLPLLFSAVVGSAIALARRERGLLVVASLPFALYIVMGTERMFFARFILPALPPLIVLAAVTIDRLAEWVGQSNRSASRAVFVIAALVAGTPTLLDAIRFDAIQTRTDTRAEARAWMDTHLEPGAHIAVDYAPFGPVLSPTRYKLLVANGWALSDLMLDGYRQRGIEYIVASSYVYDQWLLDPLKDARRRAFYAELTRGGELVAEFRAYRREQAPGFVYDQIYAPFDHLDQFQRPGPTIQVFRIR